MPLPPPLKYCFTRQATQGRGGSRGLRPFRRGREGEAPKWKSAGRGQATAGMEVAWKCSCGSSFVRVCAQDVRKS